MSDVINREAENFIYNLESTKSGLSNYKSAISGKLYDFFRDEDKLSFLSLVRHHIAEKKLAHENECNANPCFTSQDFETMLYALDQEFQILQKRYVPETEEDLSFTIEEKINLHRKIDEVIESLSHLKMGQEIIYDELDTLRQHFNLDKKTWFQLVKGKLFDVCTAAIIDKTIASEIYNGLANEVGNVTTYIDSQL